MFNSRLEVLMDMDSLAFRVNSLLYREKIKSVRAQGEHRMEATVLRAMRIMSATDPDQWESTLEEEGIPSVYIEVAKVYLEGSL